jgi:two-component system response regulator YesN
MKKTILVIDDNTALDEAIEYFFQNDFDVRTAHSGTDGLYHLQSGGADLVILDMHLPDMSGLDILKNIRSKSDLPVIVITGFGDKRIVLECWREKATHYLDKPFSLTDLEKIVTALLGPTENVECAPGAPQRALPPLSLGIQQATEYILRNIRSRISVRDVASASGMDSAEFSVRFRRECGISFKKFVERSKSDLAKKMLSDTSKSVKEIALDIGFKDPLSFSRYFKRLTNFSPSEFRLHIQKHPAH